MTEAGSREVTPATGVGVLPVDDPVSAAVRNAALNILVRVAMQNVFDDVMRGRNKKIADEEAALLKKIFAEWSELHPDHFSGGRPVFHPLGSLLDVMKP